MTVARVPKLPTSSRGMGCAAYAVPLNASLGAGPDSDEAAIRRGLGHSVSSNLRHRAFSIICGSVLKPWGGRKQVCGGAEGGGPTARVLCNNSASPGGWRWVGCPPPRTQIS